MQFSTSMCCLQLNSFLLRLLACLFHLLSGNHCSNIDVRQCVAAHGPLEVRLPLCCGPYRKISSCFGLVCLQCYSAGRCRLTGGLTVPHNSLGMLYSGGRVLFPYGCLTSNVVHDQGQQFACMVMDCGPAFPVPVTT